MSEATTSPIVRVAPADGDRREHSLGSRSIRCVPAHTDDDPAEVAVVLWTPEPDGAVASDATLLSADTYAYGDRLADAIGETTADDHGTPADVDRGRGSDAAS